MSRGTKLQGWNGLKLYYVKKRGAKSTANLIFNGKTYYEQNF